MFVYLLKEKKACLGNISFLFFFLVVRCWFSKFYPPHPLRPTLSHYPFFKDETPQVLQSISGFRPSSSLFLFIYGSLLLGGPKITWTLWSYIYVHIQYGHLTEGPRKSKQRVPGRGFSTPASQVFMLYSEQFGSVGIWASLIPPLSWTPFCRWHVCPLNYT